MIARNERTQIKKRLVKQHQQTMVAKHRSGQDMLNAVLWGLVKSMAKSQVEDYDEASDSVLTLSKENLGDVPANFGLKIESDEDSVSIIATLVKPKSNILLADGSNAEKGPN